MSFFIKAAQAESSGGKNLYNERSGATGKYQFLPSTWADLIARKPHLGLTVDGIKDPSQQEIAMQAFTEDNRGILTKTLGPDLTDADLYGAHHFGAGGYTKIRKAAPGTPIEQVLSGSAISANPYLKGKTTDQVQSILQTKMGGPKAMTPEEELQAALAQEAGTRQPPVPEMDVGALNYPMQSHVQEPQPIMAQVMAGLTGNRRDMVPGAVAPQQPPQEGPGGLQGFAQNNSDALLRFGAGMLSGKTIQEGLGRGFAGVADANQDAQAMDMKRQQVALQAEQQKALIERYRNAGAKGSEWKQDKDGRLYRTKPDGSLEFQDPANVTTDVQKYDTQAAFGQLKSIRESLKDENLVGPYAGTAGAIWDKYGMGDTNRQAKRRELEMFSKQKVLEAAGNIKGALSDKDLKFLMESQPSTTDDNQVWNEWLTKVEDRMKVLADSQGVELPQGGSQPPAAPPSGDGWNATGSGVKYRIVN